MCHCETSDRCHWLWQSASPVPSAPLPKGGWHGEAVTGGFLFAPHPGRAHGPCPTRFCVTGPGRTGSSAPTSNTAGDDAYIVPPTALLAMCHCETSDRCHWLWQSASPVPSAPLPKGGWHGEAVTGGFLFAPHPGRAHGPCPTRFCVTGPGRTESSAPTNRSVGADTHIGPPTAPLAKAMTRKFLRLLACLSATPHLFAKKTF